MRQLPLDISCSLRSFGEDDFFVSESNRLAFRSVLRWPDWSTSGLILYGAAGSGKTHLAHVWRGRSQASFLDAECVEFSGGLIRENVVCDDVEDQVDLRDERTARLMLRCVNFLAQNQYFFLLTARRPPSSWGVALPDLASRLRALPCFHIQEPDDGLLEVVLQKAFFSRQLHVSPDVISYILKRIPRTFSAVQEWIRRIDKESLSHGRSITVPFLRTLLGDESCIAGESVAS